MKKEYTIIFEGGISREYVPAKTPEKAIEYAQKHAAIMVIDEDDDVIWTK